MVSGFCITTWPKCLETCKWSRRWWTMVRSVRLASWWFYVHRFRGSETRNEHSSNDTNNLACFNLKPQASVPFQIGMQTSKARVWKGKNKDIDDKILINNILPYGSMPTVWEGTAHPLVIIPQSYFLRRHSWIHRDSYFIISHNRITIHQQSMNHPLNPLISH